MFHTHDRHSCPHRSLRRCPCRQAGLWDGKRRVSPQVARLHYAAPALAWKWPQAPCRERGCHRDGPEEPGELWLGWELVESPDSWRRACRERACVLFSSTRQVDLCSDYLKLRVLEMTHLSTSFWVDDFSFSATLGDHGRKAEGLCFSWTCLRSWNIINENTRWYRMMFFSFVLLYLSGNHIGHTFCADFDSDCSQSCFCSFSAAGDCSLSNLDLLLGTGLGDWGERSTNWLIITICVGSKPWNGITGCSRSSADPRAFTVRS